MNISVVYDDSGRILMGVVDDGHYDSPRPVPDRKTHGGTFDVPAGIETFSLEQICTTYRVDRDINQLTRSKG
jgi:hypothetical protein